MTENKWRSWWIYQDDALLVVNEEQNLNAVVEEIYVIEAKPALAEIERLKAELKQVREIGVEIQREVNRKLSLKCDSANKMVVILEAAIERRMKSDDALELSFDENFGEALAKLKAYRGEL